MGRVANKIAVVSGGGSGLGQAICETLAREGAHVYVCDINLPAAVEVARTIRADNGHAEAVGLDVRQEPQWVELMARVRASQDRLNVMVNCAGTNIDRSFPTDTSLEDWRGLMAVNLDGVFLGTKHAIALMRESAPVNGSVINISSILGLVGSSDLAAYNASKGGVRLYSKSVALSCAEKRLPIRVNSVHPGYIDTPLLRQKAMGRFADQREAQAYYDGLQPVGRMGQPQDVAFGVLYLASDESSFVTGAELVIDGGCTAR